jgi:hypothetical protein
MRTSASRPHSAVWEIPVPAEGKTTLTWRVRVKY